MARPCRHTGCPNLVISRSQKGYCDENALTATNMSKGYLVAKGDTDTMDNLRAIDKACHQNKTARTDSK